MTASPVAVLVATQNLNAVLRIMQWGVIALIFLFLGLEPCLLVGVERLPLPETYSAHILVGALSVRAWRSDP